jgi:2-oxoglutarate ferredoxin oxidoreductase subunit gamma
MEEIMRQAIILSGAGGQGLILAGAIVAEAAGVIEGKEVVQTQSYGIQARGGASQSSVIISDGRIKYPEVLVPDILLCLSQEAYQKYSPSLREGGVLIIDQDLVNPTSDRPDIQLIALPFTAQAEKMERRILANVIALGALATATGAVKVESLTQALYSRLPERNVPQAIEALQLGKQLAEEQGLVRV